MIIRELYLNRIRPFYDSDLIKVVVGIRRCGKSVLLKQIQAELRSRGVAQSQIIELNFEDLAFSFIKNEIDLYQYIQKQINHSKKSYLFFDEIQDVDGFEKAINSFRATLNCSIFLTGSNGKLLSGELATHLSGRYISFRLMPFSFKEMCEVKGLTRDTLRDEDFFDFLNYGGMPQRFLMPSENETKVYLRDLYHSIVLKDIIQRSKAKDVDLLNRIVEYMVMTTSQTFSAQSIARYFESENRKVSTETIYGYLDLITTSLIMNKAVRYDVRGKRILTRQDKYYLTDLGLSKINQTGFKTDIGPLIETVVYNELILRGFDVYVGKTTKGEIDFIAMEGENRSYYQVAYLLADETVEQREFGAYARIADHYPKYVISMDKFDFSRDGIRHVNLIDFLLER